MVTLARDDAEVSSSFVLHKLSRAEHPEIRQAELVCDHRDFLLRRMA